jgi:archaellin
MYNPNKPWAFEIMVLEEASGRMEAMEATIKKYDASKIKVKVTES